MQISEAQMAALSEARKKAFLLRVRQFIPWNYRIDCCYNRAHVMAKELEAVGVDVGKVWNYAPPPANRNPLRVSTPNDPSGSVEWAYHVAPSVPVMDSELKISRMVLD